MFRKRGDTVKCIIIGLIDQENQSDLYQELSENMEEEEDEEEEWNVQCMY